MSVPLVPKLLRAHLAALALNDSRSVSYTHLRAHETDS